MLFSMPAWALYLFLPLPEGSMSYLPHPHLLAPSRQVHALACNMSRTRQCGSQPGLPGYRIEISHRIMQLDHKACKVRTTKTVQCGGKSYITSVKNLPAEMEPHPMRRQCFSTLRDRAIFSNTLVQTGDVSCSFARSCFTYDRCTTDHGEVMKYAKCKPFCCLEKS